MSNVSRRASAGRPKWPHSFGRLAALPCSALLGHSSLPASNISRENIRPTKQQLVPVWPPCPNDYASPLGSVENLPGDPQGSRQSSPYAKTCSLVPTLEKQMAVRCFDSAKQLFNVPLLLLLLLEIVEQLCRRRPTPLSSSSGTIVRLALCAHRSAETRRSWPLEQ
uniref:Uncharacterized protein n=1 Tax=Trichuris muris TaxID=70415 RepID=A0A5S6QWS2_TRIMR